MPQRTLPPTCGRGCVYPQPFGARRAGRFARHDRIQVEHEAAIEAGQPVERAGLPEERGVRAPRRSPGVFVSGVLHLPDDVDIPALNINRLVLETLERNAHLDLVAVFRQPSLG